MDGVRDETRSLRSDEQLLTGGTDEEVRAAALAEHPGATVQRVGTDSDGVYEAHLTTSDGTGTTVLVGEDFTVTEQGGGRRGRLDGVAAALAPCTGTPAAHGTAAR